MEPLTFAKEIKYLLISDWVQKTDQRNNATKVQLDEHTRIFIGMAYKSLGEELLQEHV